MLGWLQGYAYTDFHLRCHLFFICTNYKCLASSVYLDSCLDFREDFVLLSGAQWDHCTFSIPIFQYAHYNKLVTLFESENEREKIEPVPIPLPRASRNFPDVQTRNDFFFHNWTSEIIPFIRFGMQMDGT